MGFIADLHLHTVASGHAYATLMDYIHLAKERGISCIGLSDHGPAMPGGPHLFHLGNQTVIPREIEGVMVLRGAEANIINYDGEIDIESRIAERLDYMIASLHDVVIRPGTQAENTQAVLRVIQNPKVRILGHLGNPRFDLDYEKIVEACAVSNVAIEINNSSFKAGSRQGSETNCGLLAKLAYNMQAPLIFSSDAHIQFDLADFDNCFKLTDDLGIPRDYIINYRRDQFFKWLGVEI